MAAGGIVAAVKRPLGVRVASPRNVGTRLRVTCGMSREAGKEALGRAYRKVPPGEVPCNLCAPEVRASSHLEMKEFLRDLEVAPALVDGGEFGVSCRQYARHWFHRRTGMMDALTPDAVTLLRTNFLWLRGRRVKAPAFPDNPNRVLAKVGFRIRGSLVESSRCRRGVCGCCARPQPGRVPRCVQAPSSRPFAGP